MLVHNSPDMREWESRFPSHVEVELQVELPNTSADERGEVARRLTARHPAVTVRPDEGLVSGFGVWVGPATRDTHALWWPPICYTLEQSGAVSWTEETTGLHVHLAVDSLVHPDTLRSFGYSMPLDPLLYVCGRVPGPRCRRDTVNGPNAFIVDGVSKSGHRTLEFRGGKGTLCFTRILSLIDFVLSLADYTNTVEPDSVSWGAWYRHVRAYRERFPELLRAIERYECERGISFVS